MPSGNGDNPPEIVSRIRQEVEKLVEASQVAGLTASAKRRVDEQVRDLVLQLEQLLLRLDPVRQPSSVFDPANPKIVGRFVALALIAQSRAKLSDLEPFYGAGVYALYYTGGYPAYAPLSGSETPIYVGKADPQNDTAKTAREQGSKLAARLKEHLRSISKAQTTLSAADFEYRSLVVQSGWQGAAEDYLINFFRPIWNNEINLVYGIGKHGDDAKTRANKRSPWDTLHPGREWADKSTEDAKPATRIAEELTTHFQSIRLFNSTDEVIGSFVGELRQL